MDALVSERLLPLDEGWRHKLAERPWPTEYLPEVIGSGTATLSALVREYLFISLFRACAESLASENASRLAAMERADRNIESCWRVSTAHSTVFAKVASTRSCSTSSLASKRYRQGRRAEGLPHEHTRSCRHREDVGRRRQRLAGDGRKHPTCNARFAKLGIPQTEAARRAYRELLVTTPGLGESINGAILYDETIRQQTKDGTPFVTVLTEAGIIPASKWTPAQRIWRDTPGRRSPRPGRTARSPGQYSRLGERLLSGAQCSPWATGFPVGPASKPTPTHWPATLRYARKPDGSHRRTGSAHGW